jgi:hypothetical protein
VKGTQILTDLYKDYSVLIQHNPKSGFGGRFTAGQNIETYVYQLKLPNYLSVESD